MSTIPDTPPLEPTLPGSRRRVTIPTVSDAGPVAQSSFTTPFIAGESTARTVTGLTESFNKIADETAIQKARIAGEQDQQKRIDAGDPNYIGSGSAFTLSGKAYEMGATAAMVNKKRGEIDEKLGDLAFRKKRNPNEFIKESAEIRKKILENLPASVQSVVNEDFQKAQNNYSAQINLRLLEDNFEDNKREIALGIERDTIKIFNAIRDNGLQNGEAIETGFNNITQNLQILQSYGQLSPVELRTVSEGVRQQIFGQWLQQEFQNNANNPDGLKNLKDQLRNGTYTFGALGEQFGTVIPGGKDITLSEGRSYLSILEKYETDYAKLAAGERYIFNLQHDSNSSAIADGNKGFKVTWNQNGSQTIAYDGTVLNYNEAQSRLLMNDDAKILEHKIDLRSSKLAGDIVIRAKTDSEGRMTDAYSRIANLEQQAKDAETPFEKAVFTKAAEKAKTRVDAVIKQRIADKTSGQGMTSFWENRQAFGLDPNINISQEAGNDAMTAQYEGFSNTPFRMSELPTQQANIELSAIKEGAAVSVAQGLSNIDQLIARQGRYAEGYITSALRVSSDNNKTRDYALVEVIQLRKAGKNAESEQLFSAWKNSVEIERTFKEKIGDTEWNAEKTDFQTKFQKQFGKALDLKTSYGKSLLATAYNLYLKNRDAGIMNAAESFDTAVSFFDQHHVKMELVNGNEIMFPRSFLKDKDGNNMTGYIQEQLNDIIKRPWLYNIVGSNGQTVDQIIDNQEQYTMVFDNGQFVFRNSQGDIVGQPLQKYPSDGRTLYLSDVVISTHRENKPRTVFDDTENTWELFQGKKTFSKKLPSVVKDDMKVTYGVFDETGEEFTNQMDNRLLTYGEALQKTFNDNYTQKDNQGRTVQLYNDWIVPSLVGLSAKNNSVAQAISLKAVENNLTDRDLLWAYQNIPMMSKLGLNDSSRRQYVLNRWKNDFNEISQLTTPTDGATRMSPWQVIMKLADDYGPVDTSNEFIAGGA